MTPDPMSDCDGARYGRHRMIRALIEGNGLAGDDLEQLLNHIDPLVAEKTRTFWLTRNPRESGTTQQYSREIAELVLNAVAAFREQMPIIPEPPSASAS